MNRNKQKELIQKGVIIHTPTIEEYEKVCEIADELGYSTYAGRKFNQVDFYKYSEDTCLNIKEGCYCNLEYYKSGDYKIITASEFLAKSQKKTGYELLSTLEQHEGTALLSAMSQQNTLSKLNCKFKDTSDFITEAVIWSATKESHDFWADLEQKYNKNQTRIELLAKHLTPVELKNAIVNMIDQSDIKKLKVFAAEKTDDNPSTALAKSFSWSHSNEGNDYWETIYNKLVEQDNK